MKIKAGYVELTRSELKTLKSSLIRHKISLKKMNETMYANEINRLDRLWIKLDNILNRIK